ncbi:MAG TPA: hypothetical protein VHJ34_00890 [Actinomycetota bacterium]|nr:hypothetical protein [Actinomycetota bacterium]
MSEQRPERIARVWPEPGAVAPPLSHVGAALMVDPSWLRGADVDASALRLVVDGVDRTAECVVRTTMSMPPNRVDLVYRPVVPMDAGPHGATISWSSPEGGGSYEWSFEVA